MFKWLSLALVAFMLASSGYRIFRNLRDRALEPAISPSGRAAHQSSFSSEKIAAERPLSFLGISAMTLANRALLFLVAYLAYQGIANQSVGFFETFREIWGKWDARNYLFIAENGYPSVGERRYLLVFYPLYPLAIKLVSFVVGDYFRAAIAISLTSLVAATYFLHRLIWLEFSDAALARESVKYLLIFPFSFFFSAAYTESLFLLLTVLTFYFCKRDCWLAAGVAGLLAALTRHHGVLLLLPLLIELVTRSRFSKATAPQFVRRAACASLVLVGFGLYLGLNKWLSGEWFAFVRYQNENWHNPLGFFANNVQASYAAISVPDIRSALGTWLPQFCTFFVAAAFLAASTRKLPPSYIVYSVAYLVISYSPAFLLSGSRYVTAMFPLFICMALFTRGHTLRQYLLDATLYLLLGLYVCMYPQTYTIY